MRLFLHGAMQVALLQAALMDDPGAEMFVLLPHDAGILAAACTLLKDIWHHVVALLSRITTDCCSA